MKKFYGFIIFIFLSSSIGHCADQTGNFTGKRKFPFDNLTLLIVDCGQQTCSFEFKDKRRDGDGMPFNTLDLSLGGKKYFVTDLNIGNNKLMVNNTAYDLKAFKEHLLIGQDGTVKAEAGEIHPSDQFLLDTSPGARKLVDGNT